MKTTMMMLLLLVVPARGALAHSEPAKAKTLKVQLVQAHVPCTAPNTMTSTGLPACAPEVQSYASCQFGTKGAGKLTAVVRGTSIAVRSSLRGLDACDGQTLTAVMSLRATSDDCPFTACTYEITDLPLGSCVVQNGKCAIRNTVGTGIFVGDNATGLELTGCGLKNGATRTFTCGLLVP